MGGEDNVSPIIRSEKQRYADGAAAGRFQHQHRESEIFHIQELLPELEGNDQAAEEDGGEGFTDSVAPDRNQEVRWSDCLAKSSFLELEDYGTIQPTDTHRENNQKLKEQNEDIVKTFD